VKARYEHAPTEELIHSHPLAHLTNIKMGISERKHGQWILDLALVAAAVSCSKERPSRHDPDIGSLFSHTSSHGNSYHASIRTLKPNQKHNRRLWLPQLAYNPYSPLLSAMTLTMTKTTRTSQPPVMTDHGSKIWCSASMSRQSPWRSSVRATFQSHSKTSVD
jgi:hypothetical protein